MQQDVPWKGSCMGWGVSLVSLSAHPTPGTPGLTPNSQASHCLVCPAEANAISEDTQTLYLNPNLPTTALGHLQLQPGVCGRSCEELGSMVQELAQLRGVVGQMQERLQAMVRVAGRLPEGSGQGCRDPSHHPPESTEQETETRLSGMAHSRSGSPTQATQ